MGQITIIFKKDNKEYSKTYSSRSATIPDMIKYACMENTWDEIVSVKKGKYNPNNE